MLLGLIWMIYGIGLKGPEPSWDAVPGRTVLQDTGALFQASVLQTPGRRPRGRDAAEEAEIVRDQFIAEGWEPLPEEDPAFGQAAASAACSSRRPGRSRPASSRRSPCTTSAASAGRRSTTSLDFLAFRHEPHYVVVEVAPLVETAHRAGPGAGAGRDRRDPAAPVRLHGPQPRRPAPAGAVRHARLGHRVPHAVLVAAPPGTHPDHEPQPQPGPGHEHDGERQRAEVAWASTCRSSSCSCWPSLFGVISFAAVASAGAAPAIGREDGAVRERHRAQPRAAGALPGQLLRRRDAVHHVRHRDHLPLPLRGVAASWACTDSWPS